MLVLLCALTIGQIEDVAKLRERYEQAQSTYESLQKGHDQMRAMYDSLGGFAEGHDAMIRRLSPDRRVRPSAA